MIRLHLTFSSSSICAYLSLFNYFPERKGENRETGREEKKERKKSRKKKQGEKKVIGRKCFGPRFEFIS